MLDFNMERIVLTLPGILLGITVHEFSHAYSAYLLGDSTAKNSGRLTLNPIAHLDILGFLMLLFAGFGWAKPVPVNPNNFSDRKMGYFLVSIAGPLSNIVSAIILTLILGFGNQFIGDDLIRQIIVYGVYINLVLAVFNLLPVPPLDGSKILLAILPGHLEHYFYKLERYSFIILIALLFTGVIRSVLFPIVHFLFEHLMAVLYFIA